MKDVVSRDCNRDVQDALCDLTGAVYDCASDPSGWPLVLARVCAMTGCGAAAVTALHGPATLLVASYGIGSEALQSFRPEWALDITHRLENACARDVPNSNTSELQPIMVPREELQRLRGYREWAEPNGFCDCISAVLPLTLHHVVTVDFFRASTSGCFDGESANMLRMLVPHFMRAVRLADRLDKQIDRANAGRLVLDRIGSAIVLVDKDALILDANSVARRKLDAQSPIKLMDGRVVTPVPSATYQLECAIAAAGRATANGFPFDTTSITFEIGGVLQILHVLTLAAQPARSISLRNTAAVVIVTSSADDTPLDVAALASGYALTPAQLKVLAIIARGFGAECASNMLGISVATARTHMKGIFAKLGVTSHAELVALVGRLTSPIRVSASLAISALPALAMS